MSSLKYKYHCLSISVYFLKCYMPYSSNDVKAVDASCIIFLPKRKPAGTRAVLLPVYMANTKNMELKCVKSCD